MTVLTAQTETPSSVIPAKAGIHTTYPNTNANEGRMPLIPGSPGTGNEGSRTSDVHPEGRDTR